MKNHSLYVTRSGTDPAAYPSDGVAVSSTNTYYSKKGSLASTMGQVSVFLEWTGTPTGTFTAWASDKEDPNEANDNDWSAITWTSSNPAGSAGKQRADFLNYGWRWVRIKYVNASGTGTLKGRMTVQ